MNRFAGLFLFHFLFATALSVGAYGSGSQAGGGTNQNPTSPTVTVTPEETTHPYAENLIVTATVKGGSATPTGSVTLSSGSYTSAAVTLNSGSATFYVQPGSLARRRYAHRHLYARLQ